MDVYSRLKTPPDRKGSAAAGGGLMKKIRRPAYALVLALLLAACLWIAWRVPYTHDDWDWGLPKGLQWWFSGEMNNRWCGSFFVIVMTRSQLAKTLIMGLTMFAIPLLAAAAATFRHSENRFSFTLLGCGALMAMPLISWQQTYGWVSAFSNFVMGGLLLLALILLVQAALRARGGAGKGTLAGLFLIALPAQLFAENLTVVLAAAAVLFALWAWKTGRNRPAALSVLAGALIGLVLMFCNPLYLDLASTGSAINGVRQLMFPLDAGPAAAVSAIARRFFGLILPELFECYPAVWALVCAGGVWRAVKARRPPVPVLLCAVFAGGYLFCCWLSADYIRQGVDWAYPISMLRFWGPPLICGLLALVLLTDPDRPLRLPRLALLAAAIALVCPFAMLREHGARCCFLSAVLLLLLGLSLLEDLPAAVPLTAAAAVLLAAPLIFHIMAYRVIGGCSDLREQLTQQALEQGSPSVVLPTEDWEHFYFWERNPASAVRASSYRAFYGLPDSLELVFLPPGSYNLWPDIPQEMLDNGTVY